MLGGVMGGAARDPLMQYLATLNKLVLESMGLLPIYTRTSHAIQFVDEGTIKGTTIINKRASTNIGITSG